MNPKLNILNCHLCNDAKCSKACPKMKVDRIIFETWFENEAYLSTLLPETSPCDGCDGFCQQACISKHVNIKDLINDLYKIKPFFSKMPHDLSKLKTDFFGKPMENPFMLSSSIVSCSYEKIARAFAMGWAGAAVKTISYIKINEVSPRYDVTKTRQDTFASFKNVEQLSTNSPEQDMEMIKKLKQDFPTKIILASIMGRNSEEWVNLAKMAQEAGADGLELNFSCPNMEEHNTGCDIGQQPDAVKKFTEIVKQAVTIPVLAKLTPNVANMVDAALAAKAGGADGIAAINTIKSIMEPMDKVSSNVTMSPGGMSGRAVKPIALRFIAEVKKHPELKDIYITGMGGIETYKDALDFLCLGCSSIQITTAVMEYGYRIIQPLINGLLFFIEYNNLSSVKQLVGTRLNKIVALDQAERGSIIYPKFDRNKCTKCGRCYISCRDGGQDALTLDQESYPILNPNKCAGCHLCTFVCPSGACVSSDIKVKPNK